MCTCTAIMNLFTLFFPSTLMISTSEPMLTDMNLKCDRHWNASCQMRAMTSNASLFCVCLCLYVHNFFLSFYWVIDDCHQLIKLICWLKIQSSDEFEEKWFNFNFNAKSFLFIIYNIQLRKGHWYRFLSDRWIRCLIIRSKINLSSVFFRFFS